MNLKLEEGKCTLIQAIQQERKGKQDKTEIKTYI